jgi:hypothetical protein
MPRLLALYVAEASATLCRAKEASKADKKPKKISCLCVGLAIELW